MKGPIVDPTVVLFRCASCKGFNIEFEETNWYDPNTGENEGDGVLLDGCYCTDCDGDVEREEAEPSEVPAEVWERLEKVREREALAAAASELLEGSTALLEALRPIFDAGHFNDSTLAAYRSLLAATAKAKGR